MQWGTELAKLKMNTQHKHTSKKKIIKRRITRIQQIFPLKKKSIKMCLSLCFFFYISLLFDKIQLRGKIRYFSTFTLHVQSVTWKVLNDTTQHKKEKKNVKRFTSLEWLSEVTSMLGNVNHLMITNANEKWMMIEWVQQLI